MTDTPPTSTELSEERTNLGELRTLLASDRTLMAWIRTSLALFSFSFTIYKILHEFKGSEAIRLRHPNTPLVVGLVLAFGGIAAMLMGIVEYRLMVSYLRRFQSISHTRSTVLIAYFMLFVGLVLVLGIVTSLF